MWKLKWMHEKEINADFNLKDKTVTEVLSDCDKELYPSVKLLLTILITLPASTTSAERSFSSLRRLKTWLRNKKNDDRLTGLALMHIHIFH